LYDISNNLCIFIKNVPPAGQLYLP
jgi:hypothetical protein